MTDLTRRSFSLGLLALSSLAAGSYMSPVWADDSPNFLATSPQNQSLQYVQEIESARAAFTRGDYAKALTQLEQLEARMSQAEPDRQEAAKQEAVKQEAVKDGGDIVQSRNTALSELLALRAEIMSGQIMLGLTDNKYKSAVKARVIAERAVSLAPDYAEAHIQYALATGFVARSAGAITAWRKKLPQQSLSAIERAQALAPNDARVAGLRGAWHLEIVRRAGRRQAASLFEARLDEGVESYNQALSLAPNDIVIIGNYGFVLLAIDHNKYRPMVTELFLEAKNNAAQITPKTAIERAILERINTVLKVIDQPDKLEATLKEFMAR